MPDQDLLISACLANNFFDRPIKWGCGGQKCVSTISSNVLIWQAWRLHTQIYSLHIYLRSRPMSGLNVISCHSPSSCSSKIGDWYGMVSRSKIISLLKWLAATNVGSSTCWYCLFHSQSWDVRPLDVVVGAKLNFEKLYTILGSCFRKSLKVVQLHLLVAGMNVGSMRRSLCALE